MKHTSSLKEKSPAELAAFIAQQREMLRTLRFSAAGARPKDTNSLGKTRKEIARALTAVRARAAKNA